MTFPRRSTDTSRRSGCVNAEIAAGTIAMGLGGYLAARSDAEHYASERNRELAETGANPTAEAAEVTHILRSFGLTPHESAPIVAAFRKRPEVTRSGPLRNQRV